jgi:pimeloyl-ACP methyl ester carboxylesterase
MTRFACASLLLTLFTAAPMAQQPFAIGGGESVPSERGEFSAPWRRGDAGGKSITLRYVRFRTTAAQPSAPIVFLAGGPGDAATRAFAGMPRAILESLTAIGDVIAFDQRGTGTSMVRCAVCAARACR